MRRSFKLSGIAFCLLALQLVGCQKEKPVDTSNVDQTATNILTAIAEGQADKVYDTYFTPEYRQSLSREDWKGMVDVYKKNLGAFKSLRRTMTSTTRLAGQAEGSFGFAVSWEKSDGKAILNMSLRESWQLVNIQIDASLMNTKDNPKTPALPKDAPLPAIKTGS